MTKKSDADDTAKLQAVGRPLEATVGTLGALSGAGLGALAGGPAGAIVGGIIGAAVGAATGWAADEHTSEVIEADKELDDEIGVTEGSIGASNLEHPPAVVAAPSAAASGATADASVPDAAGPLVPSGD